MGERIITLSELKALDRMITLFTNGHRANYNASIKAAGGKGMPLIKTSVEPIKIGTRNKYFIGEDLARELVLGLSDEVEEI